jgi:hypothetical protein
LIKKIEEHKILVEDEQIKFEHETTWNSCCLKVDKRALVYFTQAGFSAVIVAFCITLLGLNQDCETFSKYSPLLTLVVGIWLPQPQMKS